MRLAQILVVLFLVVAPLTASAHQPNYVGGESRITIPDGTISRAYYGELTGSPVEYEITLTENTELYIGLLAPDIPGARSDFTLVMRDAENNTVLELADQNAWEKWDEAFAGDKYLKGPERTTEVPAGQYSIIVSNPENRGKYVLAPGKAEIFTLGGIPSTIGEIYRVKTDFFEKPWYSIFEGIIGKVLLAVTIVILLVVTFVVYRVMTRLRGFGSETSKFI